MKTTNTATRGWMSAFSESVSELSQNPNYYQFVENLGLNLNHCRKIYGKLPSKATSPTASFQLGTILIRYSIEEDRFYLSDKNKVINVTYLDDLFLVASVNLNRFKKNRYLGEFFANRLFKQDPEFYGKYLDEWYGSTPNNRDWAFENDEDRNECLLNFFKTVIVKKIQEGYKEISTTLLSGEYPSLGEFSYSAIAAIKGGERCIQLLSDASLDQLLSSRKGDLNDESKPTSFLESSKFLNSELDPEYLCDSASKVRLIESRNRVRGAIVSDFDIYHLIDRYLDFLFSYDETTEIILEMFQLDNAKATTKLYEFFAYRVGYEETSNDIRDRLIAIIKHMPEVRDILGEVLRSSEVLESSINSYANSVLISLANLQEQEEPLLLSETTLANYQLASFLDDTDKALELIKKSPSLLVQIQPDFVLRSVGDRIFKRLYRTIKRAKEVGTPVHFEVDAEKREKLISLNTYFKAGGSLPLESGVREESVRIRTLESTNLLEMQLS